MDLISIVIWLLLGAVSGWVASEIMKSKFSAIGNIVLGIVGSFFGGWLANVVGIAGAATGGLTVASIITAIIGSCLLVFIFGLFKKSLIKTNQPHIFIRPIRNIFYWSYEFRTAL